LGAPFFFSRTSNLCGLCGVFAATLSSLSYLRYLHCSCDASGLLATAPPPPPAAALGAGVSSAEAKDGDEPIIEAVDGEPAKAAASGGAEAETDKLALAALAAGGPDAANKISSPFKSDDDVATVLALYERLLQSVSAPVRGPCCKTVGNLVEAS